MSSIKECTLAFFKGLAFGKGLIIGRELAENKDMAEDRWITIHPGGDLDVNRRIEIDDEGYILKGFRCGNKHQRPFQDFKGQKERGRSRKYLKDCY